MRVLFIGGTGNISIAATRLLAEQGIDLTLVNRGQREVALPQGVRLSKHQRATPCLRRPERGAGCDWAASAPPVEAPDILQIGALGVN